MGFEQRLTRCQTAISQLSCDALLITNLTNIFYLTGFSGTNATVLISPKHRIFVTDSRYALIAKNTVREFDIIISREPLATILKIIRDDALMAIGFETDISYHMYKHMVEVFEDYRLIEAPSVVEKLRMIKDATELAIIRQACRISDQAFLDVLDFIKPDRTTELQVANFLDFRMRELGATGPSFDFIVASGYRSAMPHGVASQKTIQSGEALTLDFGCYYQHYVSDMTRTIHIGHVTDQEREIYDIVLKSNQAIIDNVKSGMKRCDYDYLARQVIENSGYGNHFTHGIGHGMGLDVHEIPYFGKSEGVIASGMVVTDEPGIYLDNKYGVRIEDDLLITETGCEVLTSAPKELIVL
ncbi:TPA: M24 family metallopeptidase [Streptococcus agalactiae]